MSIRTPLLLSLILISVLAEASTISKIKGEKVLINTDGAKIQSGDIFYSLDAAGKKKSIVRVTAVKGAQALGVVTKGKAEAGQTLSAYKNVAGSPHDPATTVPKSPWSHYGVLVSYLQNKMSATFSFNGKDETANMVGNGFGAIGYYDYPYSKLLQFRGSAGIEQFQVSETHATQACDKGTSTTCNAIINYLSLYGLAKYNFVDGYTKAWFGGGGGYLFALSKRSTVLDSAQIAGNYVLTVAGGFDVNMSHGQYLPVVLEYSFFPSSNTVTANYIALRVGWGWR